MEFPKMLQSQENGKEYRQIQNAVLNALNYISFALDCLILKNCTLTVGISSAQHNCISALSAHSASSGLLPIMCKMTVTSTGNQDRLFRQCIEGMYDLKTLFQFRHAASQCWVKDQRVRDQDQDQTVQDQDQDQICQRSRSESLRSRSDMSEIKIRYVRDQDQDHETTLNWISAAWFSVQLWACIHSFNAAV